MSSHKLKLTSPNLDKFIVDELDRALYSEKILAQTLIGGQIKGRLSEKLDLDKKLLLLTALNKRFCLIIINNENSIKTTEGIRDAMKFYISTKKNYESEEKRRELGMFVIDERQASKLLFAGAYRFSETLYKIAETGTPTDYLKGFPTPNMVMDDKDRTEKNMDVYKFLFHLIEKGNNAEQYLKPLHLTFAHFKILALLFRTDKPLTLEEITDRKNNVFDKKSVKSKARLIQLVEMELVGKYKYGKLQEEYIEEEEIRNMTVYALMPKGIKTYIDIINSMTKTITE